MSDTPDANTGANPYPYTAWDTDEEMRARQPQYNQSNRKVQRLKQISMLPNYYTSSVSRRIARGEIAMVAKNVNAPLSEWKNHSNNTSIFIGFSPELRRKVLKICDQPNDDRLATIWADIPRKQFAESRSGKILLERTNTEYIYMSEDDERPCDLKKTFDEKIPEGANFNQDEVLNPP